MSALEAVGLTCGRSGVPVVRELSLTLNRGEVALLLGANGSGKTTTLMTLAGAIAPLAGEVRLNGVASRAPLHVRARAGMAFVPEGRAVFAQLSVRDNLRLGLGPPARAVELFPDLGPLMPRRAGKLSGGEQQMVRLGRVLAGNPTVLLIDELSLGLSPLVVARLFAAVRAAADAGAAVLIVEQHVRLALEFADRAHVLGDGRGVVSDTAAALAQRLPEIEARYLFLTATTTKASSHELEP
jgi:branched-chain amino acid transport system ATP-binding protein